MAPSARHSPTAHGRYDGSLPRRRPSGGGGGGRGLDDQSTCFMDPKDHKEKLPRPSGCLSARVVYEKADQRGVGSPRRASSQVQKGDLGAQERGASRQYLWTTLDSVLLNPVDAVSKLPLQLAAVCAPFARGVDSEDVPLAEAPTGPEGEPMRCTRCRCYANAYWRWSTRESDRLRCNLCGHRNELPDTLLKAVAASGWKSVQDAKPEFSSGSVDLVAPAALDRDRPVSRGFRPAACFVIESSTGAVGSGFLRSVLDAIELLLDSDDSLLLGRICFVTFDEAVSFFAPTRSGGFRAVSVTTPDDPFAPCGPELIFFDVDTEEGAALARGLLQQLRETSAAADPPGAPHDEGAVAGGTALRAAAEAVAGAGGGDVLMFHAGTPNLGLGALRPRATAAAVAAEPGPPAAAAAAPSAEARRGVGGSLPPPPLQAAFYKETLARCVAGGVAVSAVTAARSSPLGGGGAARPPPPPLHLRTLQWLAWRTGGDALHLPGLLPALLAPSGPPGGGAAALAEHLRHWASKMQASAYGCVVKLRCSKGLHCTSLLAPWPAAASAADGSAFELPRLSPDAAFTFALRPEAGGQNDEDDYRRRPVGAQQLYVQVAVLYTGAGGERLLRVHNAAVSVVHSLRYVYNAVSAGPLVALIVKQAALRALLEDANMSPSDYMLRVCLQILDHYRRHCAGNAELGSGLAISKTLCLLPLYVLSARKLFYTHTSAVARSEGSDETEFLHRVLRMPVHSLLAALYPCVLPLDPAVATDPEHSLPCFQDHISKGTSPAYLVTDGSTAWFVRGPSLGSAGGRGRGEGEAEDAAAPPAVAAAAVATLWERAREACQALRDALEPSPVPLALEELPCSSWSAECTWREKAHLAALFVEDEGAAEMSYADWVAFLQARLASMP